MEIEVLFPEICNLYGDLGNIRYLAKACPDIKIINTSLKDQPRFLSGKPDLIFMGTMTEKSQEIVVDKLLPYKEKIQELIDGGTLFFITGNAVEIFGKQILDESRGYQLNCLDIYNTVAKRQMMKRFNSLYLGQFEEMKIVGYKSLFAHSYPLDNNTPGLFDSTRGPGLNPDMKAEGVRINNFMATYVIGPIFVLNPPLAKWILNKMGVKDPKLPFEEEAMEAYKIRVDEYSDEKTGFYY